MREVQIVKRFRAQFEESNEDKENFAVFGTREEEEVRMLSAGSGQRRTLCTSDKTLQSWIDKIYCYMGTIRMDPRSFKCKTKGKTSRTSGTV